MHHFKSIPLASGFDFIIASIKPFSNAELAIKLKKLPLFKSSKIILDIGDPLTNNAADSQSNTNRNAKFEAKYLSLSNHVIVTNQETKDYYKLKFSLNEDKFSIIPQGASLDLFKNLTHKNLNGDTIRLIYAGTFYKKLRDPIHFINALEMVSGKSQFHVSFFGSNIKNTDLIEKHNRVSQGELIKAYSSSDVLLFFDNAFGIQTSGKIFELLCLRKPILFIYSNESSSLLDLVKDFANVIQVKNNVEDIYKSLLSLSQIVKSAGDINYPIEQFSWKTRANDFRSLLKSLHINQ